MTELGWRKKLEICMDMVETLNNLVEPRDAVITIESIKPGNRRLYRVVLKYNDGGGVVNWTDWLTLDELYKALLGMICVAHYMVEVSCLPCLVKRDKPS